MNFLTVIQVSLLQAVLDLAVCTLKSFSTMSRLFADVFQPLEQLLRYFAFLQGCQGNPKKVFTSVSNQLLPPVLRANYYILKCTTSTQEAGFGHLCDRTKSQLKEIMLALFSR